MPSPGSLHLLGITSEPGTELGALNRISHFYLHNTQQDGHYHGLVMNEEAEARFNQSMVLHPTRSIAWFCMEASLIPKCTFITNCYTVLLPLTVHCKNKIFSHPDTRGHSNQASKIFICSTVLEKCTGNSGCKTLFQSKTY